MTFLSGSLGFERFRVNGFNANKLEQEHIDVLEKLASGQFETSAEENVQVGFLGGDHLFDQTFDLGKNVVNDALHCAIRIDTNQVPSAIRKAWLQMELAAASRDNPSGKPSKAQRQEAKEAVEQRCVAEAATGRYRKMQHFSVLWDVRHETLYFGGSGAAAGHCAELFERAFNVELSRFTAGSIAWQWAEQEKNFAAIDDLQPSVPSIAWFDGGGQDRDFLGNEFLLWLWWKLENETDSLTLSDETEVTVMLTKTLSLECPAGESGKETIAAESPVCLPEAMQAIQSGKLPRKTGMTLIRQGQQFDLVLQAETFAISGAKIHVDEDAPSQTEPEERIDAIRDLSQTLDFLFQHYLARRTSDQWSQDEQALQSWLAPGNHAQERAA